MMYLAGDIGGTKVKLALFSAAQGAREPVVEATFPSARYSSLEAVVRAFLAGIDAPVQAVDASVQAVDAPVQAVDAPVQAVDAPVQAACFGVAGPVVEGRATITNLPWVIDARQLASNLGLSAVHLLNDLESIANAVPILQAGDVHVLNEGRVEPQAAIAVIAPGTGLGEGFLTWDGARYRAHPSEGGHTDFGPIGELQNGLLRYLLRNYEHVSYERVCSGLGLPNIYAYLRDSGYAEEPAWLAEKLAATDDVNPIIVAAALDPERPCALCAATLDTFVAILGAEAGNLAVKVLATGGVYLAGGIPPRILPALQGETFMAAFLNKGRFRDLLARMPVSVILNPAVPLMGAAAYGLERMG